AVDYMDMYSRSVSGSFKVRGTALRPGDSWARRLVEGSAPGPRLPLRRVFESLILQFIYSDKALNEFSPYQAGFRPGYNTITQLWLTQASVYHPTDPRSIHIFLDLEKAYDRVPIPRLLDKLKLRNTPTPLIQIVDSLFSQCYSQLIVNAAIGPTFRRSVGLFQGSILSPWLFNVYIDDLAT